MAGMTSQSHAARTVRVAAVGDLMLGDSPLPAGYGFRSRYPGSVAAEALKALRPALAGNDVVFGNLEVQLSGRGRGRTRMVRDMMRDVERLRCDANYVIVSLHWGEEFAADPSVAEVRFARQIIEAGAALLIGHHPHVVRPIVLHGTGCIAYSLGNAASDMVWQTEFTRGLLLQCELGKETVAAAATWLSTDRDYRLHVSSELLAIVPDDAVEGLSEKDYAAAVSASMRR